MFKDFQNVASCSLDYALSEVLLLLSELALLLMVYPPMNGIQRYIASSKYGGLIWLLCPK